MRNRRTDTIVEKLDSLEDFDPGKAQRLFDKFLDEVRLELTCAKGRMFREGRDPREFLGPVLKTDKTK